MASYDMDEVRIIVVPAEYQYALVVSPAMGAGCRAEVRLSPITQLETPTIVAQLRDIADRMEAGTVTTHD
jgi:hypothetical protein